ncbi:hypothetical protein Ddc_01201 [Ditylenchus destructor]|nr:hypothetical protein Ddc_01201 [Ditylenchus destructor]
MSIPDSAATFYHWSELKSMAKSQQLSATAENGQLCMCLFIHSFVRFLSSCPFPTREYEKTTPRKLLHSRRQTPHFPIPLLSHIVKSWRR